MPVSLQVKDLSPRFLRFYELAQDLDPESRWKLWEETYGFAAVPPTDYGRSLARKMLDESWSGYPGVMEAIRAGAAGFRPDPQAMLEATATVLNFTEDLEVQFVTYVGNLEMNAWAVTMGGKAHVHFPLESNVQEWGRFALPHEFTHVIHDRLSGGTGGWLRSIATAMMQEGLAIWTSKAVTPDLPDWWYLCYQNQKWMEQCLERDRTILTGILPRIAETSEDALRTFIMGPGPAGLDREVYWAGYRVVGELLQRGDTLPGLVRLKEEEFTPRIGQVLLDLTA